MGLLKRLLVAATGLTLAVGTAAADTTVKWLHIEVNPAQVKIWEEVARAYEAAHPGRQGRDAVPRERGLQGQAADHPAIQGPAAHHL